MTEPTTADELALLVADIYEVAGALRATGDRLAGQVGQTQARWQVLSVVSEGDWTVPAIASRLGISRQAVQRVADDLAAAGLLRYAANPAHKRSPLVQLTDAGRATLSKITWSSTQWRTEVAEALSQEQMASARETLRVLVTTIRSTPMDTSPG